MCFIINLPITNNAQPANISDKYVNAYKQYENSTCPIKKDEIKNFIYFARDRELIHNHPFLNNSTFSGAQIMYSWKQLETSKNVYDFSIIKKDYEYLKSKNKKLFIQLQDATFDPKYSAVPTYLKTKEYDGGETNQVDDKGIIQGRVAKRWNKNVQNRFKLLLEHLGKEFEGKIEGINLQESSIEISFKDNKSFTPVLYVESLKNNMLALKKSFPKSTTMIYANFMPDEWLPLDDKGYLKSIYQYGEKIGVGLGAPDLMIRKKGQLNHPITMMHENKYTVPLGIAVQDGNYIGETNSEKIVSKRKNIVPVLYAFSKDFLKLNYIFWVNQEPYFREDVLPCFLDN